jgi:hypothetical protein
MRAHDCRNKLDIVYFEDEWVGPEEDPYLAIPHSSNGNSVLTLNPVTLMGKSVTGTLTLKRARKFVTRSNEFEGTWVIKGGTDDLKGITGRETWYIDPRYGLFGGQLLK